MTCRSARALASLALILLLSPACKRHQRVVVQTTEEEAPMLASVIDVADPKVSPQLLSGFYGVEQNAWRWTAGRFSAVLRPPRSAADKGATLELHFTIPEVVISKVTVISLSASVNGTPLSPETYTKAGQYTYTREIPAHTLAGESAKVDFAVDKTMQPSGPDRRQLGIIVSSLGFVAK
jgi:hypothetical protein